MNNSFTIHLNKSNFTIIFQEHEYDDCEVVDYYIENSSNGAVLEYLPGIFCICENINHKMIKDYINKFHNKRRDKSNSKMKNVLIDFLISKLEKTKVTLIFKNLRDDYSLYIDSELIYTNEQFYRGKELIFSNEEYESLKTEPEYLDVETKNILLPFQSGGEGPRCSLKGLFKKTNLLCTSANIGEYFFFSEYEMHCLAMYHEKVKQICTTCLNCMKTVELMRKGDFIGPSRGHDHDCLTLIEYEGKYVIENGNHRTCCAKLFGIKTVKAKVYKYHKKITELRDMDLYKYERIKKTKNKKVLETFYKVFRDCSISDNATKEYLEKDGSDIGLIELLNILENN